MKEIYGRNFVCTKSGKLKKDSVGWSRNTFENCDIKSGFFRKKFWNHYMFMHEDFICVFAIINLDYAGQVFIDFYDLKNNTEEHRSINVAISQGITIHSKVGSYAHFQNNEIYINVIRVHDSLNTIVKWDNITIEGTIMLDKESMNVLVPWDDKHYHYTSKQLPLKCTGKINVSKEVFDLDESIAFIDYGRGIWERKKAWNWITCGFVYDNMNIGLNLGAGWTDNTGLNENFIKINEKVFKLNSDVIFKEINPKTWSIKSVDTDEVDLIFTLDKITHKNNNVIIIKSTLKQHVGRLNGTIITEGKIIKLENVLSYFEDHYAKW
ncbi:DUF2804 domain-containing protein [Romboutsia weinsteinii]|uniref:DUF2804 domain-containing protein n=1 Tax=Romboutsia weinsteinii TaxID=2020949 RepID=A0A371IZP0_9FIRM|nr:DUF2804 domain-containing protein [Romboutsia weinsteinii]RDY25886.1 DUF2804 domain-containing protein [Romboutsia weinsteinii]